MITNFAECEGKDGGNYTHVLSQDNDVQCTQKSIVVKSMILIANKANGEKAIVGLTPLSRARFPDGGKA